MIVGAIVVVLAVAGIVVLVVTRDSGDDEREARPILILGDYSISGSLAVAAGDVNFAVANGGGITHNVGVRGGPITADLAPGQAGKLEVLDLAPGTYELYCDIGDHEARGMVATLQVVAAAPTTS